MILRLAWIVALLSMLAAAARADDKSAPDTPEPGSAEAIAKATGDPRFLSPWVSYLPLSCSRFLHRAQRRGPRHPDGCHRR